MKYNNTTVTVTVAIQQRNGTLTPIHNVGRKPTREAARRSSDSRPTTHGTRGGGGERTPKIPAFRVVYDQQNTPAKSSSDLCIHPCEYNQQLGPPASKICLPGSMTLRPLRWAAAAAAAAAIASCCARSSACARARARSLAACAWGFPAVAPAREERPEDSAVCSSTKLSQDDLSRWKRRSRSLTRNSLSPATSGWQRLTSTRYAARSCSGGQGGREGVSAGAVRACAYERA